MVVGNPDEFELTPDEQEGIDIASAYSWAGDPKTKTAIASIVARFPCQPIHDLSVYAPSKFNSTYAKTGGMSAIAISFQYDYRYSPITFKGQLYRGNNKVGGEYGWYSTNNNRIGLAYANSTGGLGYVFGPSELSGPLSLTVSVQYDISRFTRYRNVGVGLLYSTAVHSDPFTLTSLVADYDPDRVAELKKRRRVAPKTTIVLQDGDGDPNRQTRICDAINSYVGPVNKKGYPKLNPFRDYVGIPDITRAERNECLRIVNGDN